MAREDFPILKQILTRVEARINPAARVWANCFYRGGHGGSPELAFIGFNYADGTQTPLTLTHEPGIPVASLVLAKVQPIADWIVAQISKQHPEWFI